MVEAIAEAESERSGLRRRIEIARERAATLIGTGDFEYRDREPKKEQMLTAAEDQLLEGDRRIIELSAHVDHLRRVLDLLKLR